MERPILRTSFNVGWFVHLRLFCPLHRKCDSPLRLTNYTLDFLKENWANEIDFVICMPHLSSRASTSGTNNSNFLQGQETTQGESIISTHHAILTSHKGTIPIANCLARPRKSSNLIELWLPRCRRCFQAEVFRSCRV